MANIFTDIENLKVWIKNQPVTPAKDTFTFEGYLVGVQIQKIKDEVYSRLQ